MAHCQPHCQDWFTLRDEIRGAASLMIFFCLLLEFISLRIPWEYATQHIDLGFNQLFFHSAHPDQRTFLERYAHDVLPSLRQKGS